MVQNLRKASQAYGIKYKDPVLYATETNDIEEWKHYILNDIQQNNNQKPQLVLSVIDRKDKKLYSHLKNFFYAEAGINHQNFLVETLQKNIMSVCSKLSL